MNDTMQLGPETPGRPTVTGIVAVKLKDEQEPGFVWCEGAGKSISLLSRAPGEARRMKPGLFGKLSGWQVEHREVEYWHTYTPPKVDLVALLRKAMGRG